MILFQDILLFLLTVSFVLIWIYIVRQRNAARQLAVIHARRLKSSQEKLQLYIGDLDNLLVMLVGIHE
ncbi:MAG: hypothetical protein WCG51_08130, partial [Elusimicrobiota bacterium]